MGTSLPIKLYSSPPLSLFNSLSDRGGGIPSIGHVRIFTYDHCCLLVSGPACSGSASSYIRIRRWMSGLWLVYVLEHDQKELYITRSLYIVNLMIHENHHVVETVQGGGGWTLFSILASSGCLSTLCPEPCQRERGESSIPRLERTPRCNIDIWISRVSITIEWVICHGAVREFWTRVGW